MSSLVRAKESPDLLSRLSRVLATVTADRETSASLQGVLTRFASLERTRHTRQALASARENKDQIIARIAFLAELDDVTERESDPTVFTEMALLFEEISLEASNAIDALRGVALMRGSH